MRSENARTHNELLIREAELEAENKELKLDVATLKAYVSNMESKNKELREYANHKGDCKYLFQNGIGEFPYPCTCGLDKLLEK